MISRERKCIFIHIPRTGGASIEKVIWPGRRDESELWMGFVTPTANKYQTGGLQHLLARQVRSEVGEPMFDACFKFAIVRNPWDKAVSQFAYMRRRADLRQYLGMSEDCGFSDYLDLIRAKEHVQWQRQCNFVRDESGKIIVDFIGRFETLEADARRIFERIGLAGSTLPAINASVRDRDYRTYYTASTRRAVEEIYAADIEMFQYRF